MAFLLRILMVIISTMIASIATSTAQATPTSSTIIARHANNPIRILISVLLGAIMLIFTGGKWKVCASFCLFPFSSVDSAAMRCWLRRHHFENLFSFYVLFIICTGFFPYSQCGISLFLSLSSFLFVLLYNNFSLHNNILFVLHTFLNSSLPQLMLFDIGWELGSETS